MNENKNGDLKKDQAEQHRSRRQHAYQVFESQKPKRRFRIKKKNLVFTVAVVFLALMVPIIFATAANSNEVEKIAQISTSPAPTFNQLAAEPVTTGGDLTSDLTEAGATPTAAAPSPSPSLAPMPTPSPTATPSAAPTYSVIKPGTNDKFVAVIQQRLMDLNYMDQDDPTTLYGPATKQAMEYFQRKNGLTQDGVASVQTQTLLFSGKAKPYTVSEGDSGPDVQSIQDRLVELGYGVDDTGYFGTDTTKAVKYFQRMNGLSADGNVGSNTKEILYSEKAEPSAEYTKAKEAEKEASASPSNSPSNSPSSTPKPSASASSTPKPSSSPSAPSNGSKVEAFISAALAQLNKTYVLGGKGPDVFDCSGLVYYALKASGNGIDYMTSYGWGDADQYAKISNMKDLKRGDVVCEQGHVGIYLGDGKIVNASSSNGKVIISEDVFNSNYWVSHWVCGRRVF